MKSSTVCLLGAILLSFSTLGAGLKAQDATGGTAAPTPASPATTTTTPPVTGGKRHHHHLLEQLGLSDTQKTQIEQIKQTTPKGKARKQAIMAVLTPPQLAQLKQLLAQRKAQQ
jgi:Spy/CpxP family protein refolding chaperone